MPTATELEKGWAAQYALHEGCPPGHQHEDRLREDPYYRASHEASSAHNLMTTDQGESSGVFLYLDKKNARIVQIYPRMECVLYDPNDDGVIIGIARYSPKRWKEHIELFPKK